METSADISTGAAVLVALVLTAVLAAMHLAAPRIRSLPFVPEHATGSFAGGIAVAYVFLHLLPELVEGNEAVNELLGDHLEPTPLLELGIFLVALVGFTVFYGLDRLAQRRRTHPPGGDAPVFHLHLASFAVYNGLLTYTMPLRVRTGVAFAVLFTVAMALHFVLNDRSLEEHYGDRFRGWPRFALAGALLAGWALSAVLAPTRTIVVSLLTAALAGSILLNVFKEEVPEGKRSSFRWFSGGLVVYAGLLAVVTAASG